MTDQVFLDRRALEGMGLRRGDVDRIFQAIPTYRLGDDSRKRYVRREDLDAYLAERVAEPGEAA